MSSLAKLNSTIKSQAPICPRFKYIVFILFFLCSFLSNSAKAAINCSSGGTTVNQVFNILEFFADLDERECSQGPYPGSGNGIYFRIYSGNTAGQPHPFKVRAISYICGLAFPRHGREYALTNYTSNISTANPLANGITYFKGIPDSGFASSTLTITSPMNNTNTISDPITYTFQMSDLVKAITEFQFTYGPVTIQGGRFDNPNLPLPVCDSGMTWRKNAIDPTTGVIDVGCGGGVGKCDPINGDALCTEEHPLLCFYDGDFAKPPMLEIPNRYHEWSGGMVATSSPVKGIDFPTISDANAHCSSTFGTDWRVAEFHDGWGWNFKAFGNTGGSMTDRFWANINDQPNGTCWTQD